MQIEDNLHEMSKSCFLGKNKKNISLFGLLIILPRIENGLEILWVKKSKIITLLHAVIN